MPGPLIGSAILCIAFLSHFGHVELRGHYLRGMTIFCGRKSVFWGRREGDTRMRLLRRNEERQVCDAPGVREFLQSDR